MGNAIFRSAKKRLLHVRFGHVSLTHPYSATSQLPASTFQFWPNCAWSVLIHVNTLDSLVRARACAGVDMYSTRYAPSTVVVCIHYRTACTLYSGCVGGISTACTYGVESVSHALVDMRPPSGGGCGCGCACNWTYTNAESYMPKTTQYP